MARNYYEDPNANKSSGPSAGVLGGLGAIGLGILKFGALTKILSIGFYLLIYAQSLGWPVAFGVVLLMFIHEMGHALKAVEYGQPLTLPTFIPFVGAYVVIDHSTLSGWQKTMVWLAGPVAGGLGSLAFFLAGIVLRQDWLQSSAALGFYMNLFNLAPFGGLDGRRVCAGVGSHFWILGAIMVVGLICLINPYALIILVIFTLPFMFMSGNRSLDLSYTEMTTTARTGVALLYIFTVLALAYATFATLGYLPHRAPSTSYGY